MDLTDIFSIVESGLTSIAIIAGGFWAYYGYIRKRISEQNIVLKSDFKAFMDICSATIKLSVSIANVGHRFVKIDRKNSSVFVFSRIGDEWKILNVAPFLNEIEMIEPNEIIYMDHLIELDKKPLSTIMIKTRVASKRSINEFFKFSSWSTTIFVTTKEWT